MNDLLKAVALFLAFVAGVTVGETITMGAVKSVQRDLDVREELAQVRVLAALMQCESTFRSEAVGDGGQSHGILQFKKATFDSMKTTAGMPELAWKSPEDQMVLAWWALRNGQGKHWSCYDTATRF